MKKTMQKVLALLICCVMLIALAACGKKDAGTATTTTPPPASGGDNSGGNTGDTPAVTARDTLTIAISGDTSSLDPQKLSAYSFRAVSRMYAEPLFDFDSNGNKLWLLATSIDATQTQWIIHLREGVKFNNGNPFTAEDYMFSLDKMNNDPEMPPTFPALDWEGSRIIDDYTVELNFTIYDLTIEYNMPTVQCYDKESWVDTEVYSRNPIGTGPYIVTEYVINSHCNLAARDDYWGEPAKIKNLKFKVIDEPAQIVNALDIGTVDVASIPISDIDYVKSLSDYNVKLLSTNMVEAIWFNTSPYSIFENHDARKAVCYSIDKEAIANLVYSGYATIPTWPCAMSYADFDPSYAGMDDTYKIGRDLDRAKEYAAKVDFAGKEVKIGTNGSSAAMTMAEIIQANMKEVGITAAINNYDTASWVSVQFDPTMYDLLVCSTGVPSPFAAQAYYGWFTYVDGFNKGTWEGIDRFAELAAVVQNTFDDAERAAMVKELTEIHERESIWYAAVEAQTGLAYNTALQGVEFMLLGNTYYGNWYWTA